MKHGFPRSRARLLWLVALGFFMQTLDATIVNTALPAMAADLQESPLRMQSVVVAYSVAMAMLIPASGWIADRIGMRRAFFGAIVAFVLGSVLCALSPTLDLLVASRVLQGFGGALLLPVGRLVILRTFPREEFLEAISFVAIPGLVGPLIGPTLGGWLVQVASWHWIFLINVPVGLAGLVATLRYMPRGQPLLAGRFDVIGYALLAFGMVALSLGLDGLSGLGLRQAGVVLLMAFGLAALAAYWLHAARAPQPLFSPRLFSIDSMRIGLLGNLFARLGSGSMPFLVPLMLQVGLGYSPLYAGMMMLPVAIAAIAVKRAATPLIMHFGYRRVLVVNTFAVGLMMASLALMTPGQPLLLRIAQLAVFGLVNSLQFTAMNTVTLKDLGPAMASSGNSLLSMVQMLSMGMGVAAAGAALGAYSDAFGAGSTQTLHAFQATFVSMGLLTLAATFIFAQLAPDEAPVALEADIES